MSVLVGTLVALAVVLAPRRSPTTVRPTTQPRVRPTADRGQASPRRGAPPLTLQQVAESADLLAVALSGGAPVLTALDTVAEVVGGRPGHDLRVVGAAVRWGVPVGQAWALVGPGWRQVAAAFVIADEAGAAPTGVLREAARALRHTQARAATVRAGELSARIALPLGLTFLPGFVLTTIVPVVLGLARTLLAGVG